MTAHPADGTEDPLVVVVSREGLIGGSISREVAHRAPGVLHLAVSAQVVDLDGRWLLQRRAASKRAFANCWANTCCTHPRVGEDPANAAKRRLGEELGLVIDAVIPAGAFVYRATDPLSGLVEHEVVHVFVAIAATGHAATDPSEIGQLTRLVYLEALQLVSSDQGAPWAAEVLERSFDVLDKLGRVT